MEIGLAHYLFAFFIFVLVCLIILICFHLFSDVKKQKRLLDEKESKLLRLYQSVEEIMEEFKESVESSQADIDESIAVFYATLEKQKAVTLVPPPVQRTELPPRKNPKLPEKPVAVKQAAAEKPEFKELLETTFKKSDSKPPQAQGRNGQIVKLYRQGKDSRTIAQELNITQSEVDLVIGMVK